MSRRGRGEGSIFQRGDGTWVARVDLPIGSNGKRRQRSRRARTRKEAQAKLRLLQEEVEQLVDPYGSQRTVAEAVDAYVATKSFRTEGTRQRVEWQATVIKKGLGATRIGDLSVAQCDGFLQEAAIGGFGGRTLNSDSVRRLRSVLVNTLTNEIRIGNLLRNVAEVSVLPASTSTPTDEDDTGEFRRALSHDEFRSLWRSARVPLLVVLDLCGRNGLRPAEARALRWDCVDFANSTIRIDRQMSASNKLTSTKTKRANRMIPFDDRTAETLGTWQDRQAAKRQSAGSRWTAEPALVVTTRYGTPIQAANLRRMITAACEDAMIERIVPYELRHTAISFQADAGHDAATVADWAGTSVRMIDDIYRHRLHQVAQIGPANVSGLDA